MEYIITESRISRVLKSINKVIEYNISGSLYLNISPEVLKTVSVDMNCMASDNLIYSIIGRLHINASWIESNRLKGRNKETPRYILLIVAEKGKGVY
jgi:hypothetical protein